MLRHIVPISLLLTAGSLAGCTDDSRVAELEASVRELRERADAAERAAAKPKEQLADGASQASQPGSATAAGSSREKKAESDRGLDGEKRGSASQPAGSMPARKSASRSQPATLYVTLLNDADVFGEFGPWLYIDGRMVRDYSSAQFQRQQGNLIGDSVSLTPGDYRVEVLAFGLPPYTSAPAQPFPFSIKSDRIKLEPGGQTSVSHTFKLVGALPALHAGQVGVPERLQGWVQGLQDKAERQIRLYETDLLVLELKQLDAALSARPPQTSVAMLDVPEIYGGRREVSADQIRLMVDCIECYYWGSWPEQFYWSPMLRYDGDVEAEVRKTTPLVDFVKRHREEIQELKFVARKLDQARN